MSQPTITDVMRAHAADAVDYARQRFGMELDQSLGSLERVDRILSAMYFDLPRSFMRRLLTRGPSDEKVRQWSKMWGGYVGEVLRLKWGGHWKSSLRPGGGAIVSLDIAGHRYYPIEELHQRLLHGRGRGMGALELHQRVIDELMSVPAAPGVAATPAASPPVSMQPIPPSPGFELIRNTTTDVLGVTPEDLSPPSAAAPDSPAS
jgi:hypothetical protein